MISGKTRLIAHVGYPTESFKAPLIYNPWFERQGIDAVVVPMGVRGEDFAAALPVLRRFTNLHGALITMPHKVAVVGMLDEASTAVKIAGSCNALLLRPDGSLLGDMFDGAGFVRGLRRKGLALAGASCLVVGAGGVGSAIAASLAAEGPAAITVNDVDPAAATGLVARIRAHYREIDVRVGSNDPRAFFHRKRLAGHARFADQEILCLHDEAVGWNQISRRQQDDVAWNDGTDRYGHLDTVPQDPAGQFEAALQFLDGCRRAIFL